MGPACRCVSRLPDPKYVAGGRNEPSVPVCFQAAGPEMRGGRAENGTYAKSGSVYAKSGSEAHLRRI